MFMSTLTKWIKAHLTLVRITAQNLHPNKNKSTAPKKTRINKKIKHNSKKTVR